MTRNTALRFHVSLINYDKTEVRMSLNYKGLEYKTVFSEYVTLASTLKDLGIALTLTPALSNLRMLRHAIQLPDGRCIMGSVSCAEALEELYPEPSLRLNNNYVDRALQVGLNILLGTIGEQFPRIWTSLPPGPRILRAHKERVARC